MWTHVVSELCRFLFFLLFNLLIWRWLWLHVPKKGEDGQIHQVNLLIQRGTQQDLTCAIQLLIECEMNLSSEIKNFLLCAAHLKQHRHKEASTYNSRTLALNPTCPLIISQAGEVYEAIEDYPRAIDFYESIETLSKNHGQCDTCSFTREVNMSDLVYRLRNVKIKMNLKKLFRSLSPLGEKPLRIQVFQAAQTSSIENKLIAELDQEERILLGNSFRDRKNFVKAKECYENVENDPEAFLNLGLLKFMGKGGEEDPSGAVKLILKAAQTTLYHATTQVINRNVYDARCLMDIFAKGGLGKHPGFESVDEWINRDDIRAGQCSASTVSKTMAHDTNRNENSSTVIQSCSATVFNDPQPLTSETYFKNALEKVVIAINEFINRLPVIGDCNIFFENDTTIRDFFSGFLQEHLNKNGEHQLALQKYKEAVGQTYSPETSLVIVVAELLFGMNKNIRDTEDSLNRIISTSSNKMSGNVKQNDACYFLDIEAKRILEIINEF